MWAFNEENRPETRKECPTLGNFHSRPGRGLFSSRLSCKVFCCFLAIQVSLAPYPLVLWSSEVILIYNYYAASTNKKKKTFRVCLFVFSQIVTPFLTVIIVLSKKRLTFVANLYFMDWQK